MTSSVAGGYAQLEYALTPTVHAGAGVRVEYVGYDYDNRMLAGNTDENGVPCVPSGCLYSRPADRNDSFTNAAPKLSLRWDAADGLMLYANLSRGFRPPEMTELYRLQRRQAVSALDSEQIDGYELGVKFARDDWSGELAGFDMRKDNVILRDSNGFYVSDGRTSHEGLKNLAELGRHGMAGADVSGTFARHRYEFSRAIEGGKTITSGNDVDTAPRDLARAGAALHTARDGGRRSGMARRRRIFPRRVECAPLSRARIAEPARKRGILPQWTATLRLNNALDRAYADRADFAFGDYRYFPAGRGRSSPN